MIINVSVSERDKFGYLLPVQGSLSEIELVVGILNKTKIKGNDDLRDIDVEFSKDEIDFLKENISILDSEKKLNYESLSLIKKIIGS